MAPDVRRLPATDGVALHALVWDGGEGVPVLLVHGLASNCRTWEAVGERLSRLGHPVAAVDLRGHGRSDKPDDGYDFATMGADLLAAMDDLGFVRPVVAGQSTGGNLALDLGHRAPDRVAAVVGVDGGSIELQHQWSDWDDCVRVLAPPRLAGLARADIAAHLRRAHPSWDDAGVEATLANFEVLDDGTIRPWLTFDRHLRILRALWEHRPSKVLPELDVPLHLLLVDGDDAWAVAKRAEAVQAQDYGARVKWFPGADHDVHVQLPDEVAAELHGIVQSVTGSGR
ncbi:MAG: esterase [Actinomycetota bacterium]|jgi:pimeloyl-ACP methyl ester carboxylesterase|nr:esterase [Actinomycetota bacterium]